MNRKCVGAIGIALLLGGCSSGSSDKNCSDFSCQQDAQAWHNSHPGDGLDGDGDGIACESLPNCSSLGAHQHLALPAIQSAAQHLSEGGVGRDELAPGVYRAVHLERPIDLDLLIEPCASDPGAGIRGAVRWGEGEAASAQILAGACMAEVAWLELGMTTARKVAGLLPTLDDLPCAWLCLDLSTLRGVVMRAPGGDIEEVLLGAFVVYEVRRFPAFARD